MWHLEGYSRETDFLIDECVVPDMDEVQARRILRRPGHEVIDGGYPVDGPILRELAARADHRIDSSADYFLTEWQD